MSEASGEELAVELAGTLTAGGGVERDLLASPRGLRRFLDAVGVEDPALALRLVDFRELRDAVRSVLLAAAESGRLPPDAVRVLNEASAAVPVVRVLDAGEGASRARDVESGPAAARVLARIARAAIDLVGGDGPNGLRTCGAPGCGRPFVVRGTRRVWCSTACGNRVRAGRHRARTSGDGTNR